MKVEMKRFEEGTDYDRDRGFYRFKRAVFTVNGIEHTLRISMKDFNDGKTPDLVNNEARIISAAMDGIGKSTVK